MHINSRWTSPFLLAPACSPSCSWFQAPGRQEYLLDWKCDPLIGKYTFTGWYLLREKFGGMYCKRSMIYFQAETVSDLGFVYLLNIFTAFWR